MTKDLEVQKLTRPSRTSTAKASCRSARCTATLHLVDRTDHPATHRTEPLPAALLYIKECYQLVGGRVAL